MPPAAAAPSASAARRGARPVRAASSQAHRGQTNADSVACPLGPRKSSAAKPSPQPNRPSLVAKTSALTAQKAQVDRYVVLLEKQLPSKAEMAALLSDINQAGVGRGLQFELFKPGQVVARDYYAELPIDIKVTGSYHDIGAFAGYMANLPRIVTLNNMELVTNKDGALTLNAVAKTFRYLDQDEVAAQKKAAAAKKKKGAKK